MIRHIRKYCSKRITKLLINAIVLSRIDYCGSLFSDLKNIEVKKIDRIIRASIRLIYNINRSEHLKTNIILNGYYLERNANIVYSV